jgi:phosphoenolpyruvate synthase/pyruvate phosphate dikinase
VDAQVPLVMALDDPGADPGVVGGKGASLARLARAGFRVPPGFHVTTSAYLDFIGRGEAAVLEAVRRCWASLWSARAIGYRARRGIEPGEVSIAVVVQQLVPAEAAGVMFTVDPLDGKPGTVVISANWGLGESVVAGDVTPDVVAVDRASGALVSYQVGSKEMMTVANGAATRATDTPARLAFSGGALGGPGG